jgi:hypothetical protein
VTTPFCAGFGYSARQYTAIHDRRFGHIVSTTRANPAAMPGSTLPYDRAVKPMFSAAHSR